MMMQEIAMNLLCIPHLVNTPSPHRYWLTSPQLWTWKKQNISHFLPECARSDSGHCVNSLWRSGMKTRDKECSSDQLWETEQIRDCVGFREVLVEVGQYFKWKKKRNDVLFWKVLRRTCYMVWKWVTGKWLSIFLSWATCRLKASRWIV